MKDPGKEAASSHDKLSWINKDDATELRDFDYNFNFDYKGFLYINLLIKLAKVQKVDKTVSSKIVSNRTHKLTLPKSWFLLLPTLAEISSLGILSQLGRSPGFNASLIVSKSPIPLRSWKANLVKALN